MEAEVNVFVFKLKSSRTFEQRTDHFSSTLFYFLVTYSWRFRGDFPVDQNSRSTLLAALCTEHVYDEMMEMEAWIGILVSISVTQSSWGISVKGLPPPR